MDDLISRKALKEAINVDCFEHFTGNQSSSEHALLDIIILDIDEVPTVDAEPVRYGQWVEIRIVRRDGNGKSYTQFAHECTQCKRLNKHKKGWNTRYCPNCGAKMDADQAADREEKGRFLQD